MGRKQLPRVVLPDNWTSIAGALEGSLRALGDPATTAWIMGITGLAFRCALPLAPIGVGGGQTAYDPDALVQRIRLLGYKAEAIVASRADRDFAKRRAAAIKRVHKSIDRGAPAIVHDLHLPRFGLVTGYDDGAALWFVRSMLSGQTGDRLPVDRWPVPEREQPVFVVAITGRTKTDSRRAVQEALRYAVAYAVRGEPGDQSGALHGRAAIVRWAEAFAAGEPVDPFGNAMLVQTWQSARRDAVGFLRGEAMRLLPERRPALERAAAAYTAQVLAISRMMTMFPFPSGGDTASPASRVVAVGALREALAREDDAIEVLRSAGNT